MIAWVYCKVDYCDFGGFGVFDGLGMWVSGISEFGDFVFVFRLGG